MALNPPEVADGDIRVKALRIFPVADQLPPISARKYINVLPADGTTRIGVELEFSHAPLGHAAKLPVDCWFFWPDGQTSPPLVLSYEPQPTWAGGYSAGAMGFRGTRQLDERNLRRELLDPGTARGSRALRNRLTRQDFPTTS